jgi:hypothetical protein
MVKSSKHLPMVALILAIALIGLLVALATLQYKWLGELSDSKLELTRTALRAGALRLSEDFDHELASIFVSFLVDRSVLDRGAEEYAKVYDRWAMAAPYPKLIRSLYFVRTEEDEELQPLRFDWDNHRLDSSNWPEGFETLREEIAERSRPIPFGKNPADFNPPASLLRVIDGEIPAMIIPMFPKLTAKEMMFSIGSSRHEGPYHKPKKCLLGVISPKRPIQSCVSVSDLSLGFGVCARIGP